MSSTGKGTITQTVQVYTCAACNAAVEGHMKYRPAEVNPSYRDSMQMMSIDMKLVGMVVPEHNCIPPATREAHTTGGSGQGWVSGGRR